ncbi:MAG: class I SAM-dependent methyltransferase [Chloroflexota bacterium]
MSSHWAEREAYQIGKAKTLIEPAVASLGGIWADLGCGDGIFTAALHGLLHPDHQIYGVDKKNRALRALARNFADSYPDASLTTLNANFTHPLSLPLLDGIIMANSLHFTKKKEQPLIQIKRLLKPGGRLVIIEYNANRGNFAVPYPIDEFDFVALAQRVELVEAQIVAKIPSSFLGEMYAGLAFVR